jgi:lactate dehydrogenase-like 2-hydroxyacid dehydrogenase
MYYEVVSWSRHRCFQTVPSREQAKSKNIGATTLEALKKMTIQSTEDVLTVFRGETPQNVVTP